MTINPLVTDEQLERYFSAYGLAAFADNDADEIADNDVIADCKTFATGWLLGKLQKRYPYSSLTACPMIAEVCAVITLRRLTRRRGNPCPQSLADDYEEYCGPDGLVDQIANGDIALTDANGNSIVSTVRNSPAHANLMIDRRMSERRVRVVTGSSNMGPTALRRDADLFQEGDR